MIDDLNLPEDVAKRVQEWLGDDYDEETRAEIMNLLEAGERDEILDRFGSELDFGTGGLRGIIGAGSNRMNVYNVRKATQGLVNYIKKQGKDFASRGVVIAYDSRRMSDVFALETALVVAGNGLKAYLFDSPAPTPELSFAVRHLKAASGVVITASHNPPEYNGYKVFWEDGAQVVPPHDRGIIGEVRKVKSIGDVKKISREEAEEKGLLQIIGKEIDSAYMEKILNLMFRRKLVEENGDKISIVYSPLHGTGGRVMPDVLKTAGFKNIHLVEEQLKPDGNFPTLTYPNPEYPSAMEMAVELGRKTNANLVFASDPDADRIGVGVRNNGNFTLLNGNQIGSLLAYYILSSMKEKNAFPENPFVVKTIVTTDLISEIAEDFGVKVEETLTGFKYIGEKIRIHEEKGDGNFVFGGEESHGYLAGTFVRDKDSIIAGLLFSELVMWAYSTGKTTLEILNEIYKKYGYYREKLKDITIKGVEGREKIKEVMALLRENPPEKVSGRKIETFIDIKNKKAIRNGKETDHPYLALPESNVLVMFFEGGLKIVARPSGTEPKIKFYFSAKGEFENRKEIDELVDNSIKEFLDIVGLADV